MSHAAAWTAPHLASSVCWREVAHVGGQGRVGRCAAAGGTMVGESRDLDDVCWWAAGWLHALLMSSRPEQVHKNAGNLGMSFISLVVAMFLTWPAAAVGVTLR
jgi:hypothetical protein